MTRVDAAARPAIRVIAITLAIVGVVIGCLALLGTGPDVVLLGAAGLLAAATFWYITDMSERTMSTGGVAAPPATPPAARIDHRLMTLRNGIAYGRSSDASTERLRAALVDLVDDQLRTAHHVDRSTDPERAAAVLGPELAAFVDEPDRTRRLTRTRDLDRIVTLIERL